MKKKLLLSGIVINGLLMAGIYGISESWWITGMFEIVFLFFVAVLAISFLFLNRIVKKTNWYKTSFRYTNQFVSNVGYREDLIRNYEVVNLGSNPARYAFMYDSVLGQNWSTGTQSLNYDFRILKYYHSYLKRGGIVIIPLVVFSSCYADELTIDPDYHIKFNRILPSSLWYKNGSKFRIGMRYPLLLHPLRGLLSLLRDSEKDLSHMAAYQPLEQKELVRDAGFWIDGWKNEFDITDLNAPLSPDNIARRQANVKILCEMIDFCLERQLKPVLLVPPMTCYLSSGFSDIFRENYIYSFVREVNIRNIPFMDYMKDKRFGDPELYFNSFFLNVKGRKSFTQQVLKDLKLI